MPFHGYMGEDPQFPTDDFTYKKRKAGTVRVNNMLLQVFMDSGTMLGNSIAESLTSPFPAQVLV